MTADTNAKIVFIAEQAHEANRVYCKMNGDDTQKRWAEASVSQQASAVAGVKAVIANPTITPEGLHESWSAQKVAEGWVYGVAKDEAAKTHHCLVPYGELPLVQRVKDTVFSAVVKSALIVEGIIDGNC